MTMLRSTDIADRPLLIGGMHRSGTSLTASLAASAGIDLGPELLGANASNPLGHFEDLGIQDFHRRALMACGLGAEGYTATDGHAVPAALEPLADALIAARQRPGVAWGWKEPRTTLFLDFWQDRLPNARHLFVFRRPWEVADSLFRRGDGMFMANPMFAFDVWTHYNRLIRDFVQKHPTQCAIFDIAQVIRDPQRVFEAVRTRFGLPPGRPASRFRHGYFMTDAGRTRAVLVREVAPEAWQVYLDLRALAGLTEQVDVPMGGQASLGDCAVLEWARASRTESELRAALQRRRAARRAATAARLSSVIATVRRLLGRSPVAIPAGEPELLAFPRPADLPDTSRAA